MANDTDPPLLKVVQDPPKSGWRCELFGLGPGGIIWYPNAGNVPNAFHRFMQRLCFGCRWIKEN